MLAKAFRREGVQYLFIGKSGAILLGYPSTTQDVDVFPKKSPENGRKIVNAIKSLGFEVDNKLEKAILQGRDFIQIKTGPFDVDLVFAPDGIDDFDQAYQRREPNKHYPVASLRDIIASKKASGRERDMVDIELLHEFMREYLKTVSRPLRTTKEKIRFGVMPDNKSARVRLKY